MITALMIWAILGFIAFIFFVPKDSPTKASKEEETKLLLMIAACGPITWIITILFYLVSLTVRD